MKIIFFLIDCDFQQAMEILVQRFYQTIDKSVMLALAACDAEMDQRQQFMAVLKNRRFENSSDKLVDYKF